MGLTRNPVLSPTNDSNMTISTRNNCVICCKTVGPRAYALQCDGCRGWTHIKCAKITVPLYLLLREQPIDFLEGKCPTCKRSAATATCSSNPESVDLDVTCIPADPVAVSTPVHSSDEDDADTPPESHIAPPIEPSIRTYADVASTSHPAAVRRTKTRPRNTRRPAPTSAQADDLAARVQQLENLINSAAPILSTASTPPSPNYSRPNRERCLLVVKTPESSKETPAERIVDDQKFLQSMISVLFDSGDDEIHVLSAFRLGKKSDDPIANPRPLKVVLSSEEEARLFSHIPTQGSPIPRFP